jgi:hypothetical protein
MITAPLAGAATFSIAGHPTEARAQTASQTFCPPAGSFDPGLSINLQNGACTTPINGAFSGAALASQALSELSETTTQETTRNVISAVSARRAQEEQRCPEGFSRVDGTCKRIPPQITEAAPVAPARPPEERVVKKVKKPKAAAVARKPAPAKVVYRAPPPPPVVPVPIEPAIRFGTWAQVYGDYEKRTATGFVNVLGTTPTGSLVPQGATVDVQSRTGTVGFLAGADLTSRGVIFGNDGLITGVLAGFVSSDLTLNTSSFGFPGSLLGVGSSRLNANISGATTGLYATYFNGQFSTDFTLRIDALTVNETFNEALSCSCDSGFPPVPSGGGGSVGLLKGTLTDNLNYRFDLYPNFWVEPTAGAQYTFLSYGAGAAQLGLDNGFLVMVQGGARFGTTTLINDRILMTTTLTGLAYDDVLIRGGFIPGAAFEGNNILRQADEGQVRGHGIVALNFDWGEGVTSFIQGEARGGKGLFGAGGRAGVRVQW